MAGSKLPRLKTVIRVRRGPAVQSANGRTVPEWVALDLACGHTVVRRAITRKVRCRQCGVGWAE